MKKIYSQTIISSVVLGAVVFSQFFFSGCLATSKEIVELRDDINQLRIKLNELQINQADLADKMSSLDLSMSALGEKLEENKNAMSLVSNRLDDIESGISSRFGRLETRMDAGFNRLSQDISKSGASAPPLPKDENVNQPLSIPSQSLQSSSASPVGNSVVEKSTSTPVVSPLNPPTTSDNARTDIAGDVSPGALYRMAYDDFVSGRYESATATFKVFLEKYPGASLAPYARYYMAESKYARSLYDGALEDFEYVVKNYPRSDMALPALYKKAVVLEQLNRQEDAKKIYSDIVKRYPTSQEASMSSERLKGYLSPKPQPSSSSPKNEPTPSRKKDEGEKE